MRCGRGQGGRRRDRDRRGVPQRLFGRGEVPAASEPCCCSRSRLHRRQRDVMDDLPAPLRDRPGGRRGQRGPIPQPVWRTSRMPTRRRSAAKGFASCRPPRPSFDAIAAAEQPVYDTLAADPGTASLIDGIRALKQQGGLGAGLSYSRQLPGLIARRCPSAAAERSPRHVRPNLARCVRCVGGSLHELASAPFVVSVERRPARGARRCCIARRSPPFRLPRTSGDAEDPCALERVGEDVQAEISSSPRKRRMCTTGSRSDRSPSLVGVPEHDDSVALLDELVRAPLELVPPPTACWRTAIAACFPSCRPEPEGLTRSRPPKRSRGRQIHTPEIARLKRSYRPLNASDLRPCRLLSPLPSK